MKELGVQNVRARRTRTSPAVYNITVPTTHCISFLTVPVTYISPFNVLDMILNFSLRLFWPEEYFTLNYYLIFCIQINLNEVYSIHIKLGCINVAYGLAQCSERVNLSKSSFTKHAQAPYHSYVQYPLLSLLYILQVNNQKFYTNITSCKCIHVCIV